LVFIGLAQKAHKLTNTSVLEGWLFRATRFASLKALRSEYRHQHWIREAARMENPILGSDNERDWERMVPILYETISLLHEKDRLRQGDSSGGIKAANDEDLIASLNRDGIDKSPAQVQRCEAAVKECHRVVPKSFV
jgi:hypothetical protein